MEPRALFERACAQCHGVSGQGEYFSRDLHPAPIAGVEAVKVVHSLRPGGGHDPVFAAAAIPDAALAGLGEYVHETLARPPDQPGRIGPRALDPFTVGVLVWGALGLFLCALSWLFAEGRN